MSVERSCAVTAVALSGQRRDGARLVTGDKRVFGLNASLKFVHVPYPTIPRDWTRRTVTCGVALQCSPSKERVTDYRLNELSARELRALTNVEGGVAVGMDRSALAWTARRDHGECCPISRSPPATWTLRRCSTVPSNWPTAEQPLGVHPLLGDLPLAYTAPQGLTEKLRRSFGRMPWTTTQKRLPRPHSVPVGGDGGVRNPNLPPPSQTAGQRLRHHSRAPARHSVPRMERLDEELPA